MNPRSTITSQAVRNIISRWEAEAKESIEKIKSGCLPKEAKMTHIKEILETLAKDRAEMELLSIRNDLKLAGNPEDVKAEMYWAQEDMKSDRVPFFLRPIFEKHYTSCAELL